MSGWWSGSVRPGPGRVGARNAAGGAVAMTEAAAGAGGGLSIWGL